MFYPPVPAPTPHQTPMNTDFLDFFEEGDIENQTGNPIDALPAVVQPPVPPTAPNQGENPFANQFASFIDEGLRSSLQIGAAYGASIGAIHTGQLLNNGSSDFDGTEIGKILGTAGITFLAGAVFTPIAAQIVDWGLDRYRKHIVEQWAGVSYPQALDGFIPSLLRTAVTVGAAAATAYSLENNPIVPIVAAPICSTVWKGAENLYSYAIEGNRSTLPPSQSYANNCGTHVVRGLLGGVSALAGLTAQATISLSTKSSHSNAPASASASPSPSAVTPSSSADKYGIPDRFKPAVNALYAGSLAFNAVRKMVTPKKAVQPSLTQ